MAREPKDPDDLTERGTYGDTRIRTDELDNTFRFLDEDKTIKAKRWTGPDGQERVYLRVRDPGDGRRFNEYSIDLPRVGLTREQADELAALLHDFMTTIVSEGGGRYDETAWKYHEYLTGEEPDLSHWVFRSERMRRRWEASDGE